MTSVCLGVGGERKSKVLVLGLAANHCCCSTIAAESAPRKARAYRALWNGSIIQFSRLRLVDDLPGFVEALQGKGVVGEIAYTKLH